MSDTAFWQVKSLDQMTPQEWESLCDGCAKCCLHKLEDEDSGEVWYTNIHCRYLESESCQCTVYQQRNEKVPTCVWLTADQAREFKWLPDTCAYRLLAENKPLPDWHPLVSGDKESVHNADVSIKNKGISDDQVPEDDWEDHIIWKA
ncbi:MAG: YcgN family cysteine cluster protein [Oceanobacter sp.]